MSISLTLSRFACWILLACSLQLGSAGSLEALAAAPLAWKFVPNETLNYRLTQNVKMTMDLAEGGTLRVVAEQTLDLAWQVEKVAADGAGQLLLKIKRIQWNIDGPGEQGLQYDSSAEGKPQGFAAMLGDLLKSLTIESYQVTLSPRGKITQVEIPDTLLETIDKAPGSELMGGLATQTGFQAMLQSCLLVLPENGPIQPGDEWTVSAETSNPVLGGKPHRTTTCRYLGPRTEADQKLEEITWQAVTDLDAAANPEGTTFEVTGQQSSGEALFLRSSGRLESSTDRQTMTLRITTGKQSVEQTLEQSVKCQWIAEEK